MTDVAPNFEAASDAALAIAISRYEQSALAEAYKRHAGAVFALARRLLVDQALAEEVVQEVFLRLWNDPTRFDPDRGSLRSFLLIDAHGRAVDSLRSDASRREREDRDARKTAANPYDLEYEAGDLVVVGEGPQRPRTPARRRAGGDRGGLLRWVHLPRGRGPPRRAGGYGQEPDPQRSASTASRARGRWRGGRDMTPDDRLDELLGAYALDAVDDIDRRRVEAYLADHPEARAEVWQMRQAASMLAHAGNPAPDGVWDRIADTLEARPPRPDGRLPVAQPAAPSRRRLAAGAGGRSRARRRACRSRDRPRPRRRDEPSRSVEQAYEAARDDPDGRLVSLASEDGTLSAEAVVQPDGVGFLSAGTLPELPATETYQLWGVYGDGDVISLGVVGNRPAIEPFAAEGDLDALVITREAAGGVVASTSGALLVGEVA